MIDKFERGERVDLISHYEVAPENGEVLWIKGNDALVDWGGSEPELVHVDNLAKSEAAIRKAEGNE